MFSNVWTVKLVKEHTFELCLDRLIIVILGKRVTNRTRIANPLIDDEIFLVVDLHTR